MIRTVFNHRSPLWQYCKSCSTKSGVRNRLSKHLSDNTGTEVTQQEQDCTEKEKQHEHIDSIIGDKQQAFNDQKNNAEQSDNRTETERDDKFPDTSEKDTQLDIWGKEGVGIFARPGYFFKPTPMQKVYLVVGGAYSSVSEVPKYVSPSVYTRAKEWFNIYINILAICFFLVCWGFLKYLQMDDLKFAQKYDIDLNQDEVRRRKRMEAERVHRQKLKELKKAGENNIQQKKTGCKQESVK